MSEQNLSWLDEARALIGHEYGKVYAWDAVNQPMVRQWCEAMGVDNPLYLDGVSGKARFGANVAPPTMLQVWVLAGLKDRFPEGSATDNPYEVLQIIERNGYPSVVAVNSEQRYLRYLKEGEKIAFTSQIESVSEQKTTGLGTGFFVTQLLNFYDEADALVGQMRFRLFKFRAPERVKPAEKPRRPLPGVSDDNRFFWDGLKERKLKIQRCTACNTLRHPPGPACPDCHSLASDSVEVSGRGRIYSYSVVHHPTLPGVPQPNPVGLIELAEGVRVVAGLVDVDPAHIEIGREVEVDFLECADELVIPVFRPVGGA
ncbi:bifunctional MaoC family dehydratase N-terminal/OB-fold nucleic acid binding domain-containing protein [Crenobacter intestini]|uniref:DNA-binding protein n=1 Tax=Crenobacter intestini TaxID=2563443 RepID=A0A4T0UNC3_9NEIS|nr:bifunctional MaoC family dehydratase N-terminal/OB-fold nucleic acid binding domain-containing protein [Crenobacter intestini]TIC79785.1 DNA-binding protein [Crenobacter intestini]